MGRHAGDDGRGPETIVRSEWDTPSEPYRIAGLGVAGVALVVFSLTVLTGTPCDAALVLGCLLTLPAVVTLFLSSVAYAVNRWRTRRGAGILYGLGAFASAGVGGLLGLDAVTVGTAAFAVPVVLVVVAVRLAVRPRTGSSWRWRSSAAVAVGAAASSTAVLFL